MTQLKLLSTALLATAVIASPAMARRHHVVAQPSAYDAYAAYPAPVDSYAAAPSGYGNRGYGYRCVPAPRVGQFAGGPWGPNNIPCEPGTATY